MNAENSLPINTEFFERRKFAKTPREQLMTVGELAEWANLSISKIYQDVELEAIPYHRWGRSSQGKKPVIRFQKSEIIAWLKKGCPINKKLEN